MHDAPNHPYARIARELAETPFSAISYAAATESTNADAAALLDDDRFAGLTIVAEHQTRGAGRKGRSWIAEPGTSLLFTTLLPHALPSANLWVVPFWVALAVRRALERFAIAADVQWPNDLLVAGRKIAGILCVSRVAGETARVACGVGINVHRPPGGAGEIDPPAAFCDDVAPVERGALLGAVLRNYATSLASLENPQGVARAWEGAASLPGVRYRILKDGSDETFEATALELANGGALVVERDDGAREALALADARVLR